MGKKDNCTTCKYSGNWPTSAAGRRLSDGVTDCKYPIPPLPESVTGAYGFSLHRRQVHKSMGENCPVWEKKQ